LVLPLFDTDGDGVINYKEFSNLIEKDDMCTRKVSVFLPFLQRKEMNMRITQSTKDQRDKRIKVKTGVAGLLNRRRESLTKRFRKKKARPVTKLYADNTTTEPPSVSPGSEDDEDDELDTFDP
jgi:hypothetical protein